MQRRYRADLARAGVKWKPPPAGLDDTVFAVEQRLSRRIAETDQDVGISEFDLAQCERETDRRLLRRRRAIARRTPRHDVGDIGRAAVKTDCRHHTVEQFARAADERQSLDILVACARLPIEGEKLASGLVARRGQSLLLVSAQADDGSNNASCAAPVKGVDQQAFVVTVAPCS